MAFVLSVNVGSARPIAAKSGWTGIDKLPAASVAVREPPPSGSGLAGDTICDSANHGGPDQAVYAYAREDLDAWERELGRTLRSGSFGENLTTDGLDVTGALIGQRWRIGRDAVLQVTVPRIPCRTFAVWLGRNGWVKTFVQRAVPGAYLRVARPGLVSAGDRIEAENRPAHDVTVGMVFRALTTQPELLPRLLAAEELPEDVRARAIARSPFELF
ncbi:MOSC domain-containing protein [Saccharopolyspora shandongensis]|uniref:MOSC domain-containing protein n=1 Tax=Saccharopolyspora shandongensis TaxID=418495 RepID=UPI0033CF9CEE